MPMINSTNNLFENCNELTYINLNFLNSATNWEKAEKMFSDCTSLIEVVFPEIKTKSLFDISNMFLRCTNLRNINLEGLNTNSIRYMISMFEDCKNLQYLNIYNLDTRTVNSFKNIFKGVGNNINIYFNSGITHPDLKEIIEEKCK